MNRLPRSTRHLLVAVAVALSAASGLRLASADTPKIERNFAGSAQLDYLAVPTEKRGRDMPSTAPPSSCRSSSRSTSPTRLGQRQGLLRLPRRRGRHGVLRLRVADELNFRVGRFTPAFGEFPLRHDPANHRTSDKPLPYDMGRMLRRREWNMGVLPAPVGRQRPRGRRHALVRRAVPARLRGLRGRRPARARATADSTSTSSSRARATSTTSTTTRGPTVGGALALTLGLAEPRPLTLGGSGMCGTYDPDRLSSTGSAGQTSSCARRARLPRRVPDPPHRVRRSATIPRAASVRTRTRRQYDDFFLKEGFYVELEVPVGPSNLVRAGTACAAGQRARIEHPALRRQAAPLHRRRELSALTGCAAAQAVGRALRLQ